MKTTRLNPLAALIASLVLVVVAGGAAASAAPENKVVSIDNFAFTPAEITVSTGSTVTWKNLQSARHTTTADFGEWDSDIMTSGTSFDVTFDQPGDFTYHCEIHEEMVGVVHVVADAASAPVVVETAADDAQDEPILDLGTINETPVILVAPAPAPAAPAPAAPTPAPTPAPSTYSYGY
jgi:plastocyanin